MGCCGHAAEIRLDWVAEVVVARIVFAVLTG
jgi:hypothetical protein